MTKIIATAWNKLNLPHTHDFQKSFCDKQFG